MSYYDYDWSKHLEMEDPPFYGLIMAAMRKADTENLIKLRSMWPRCVCAELYKRYNAPGGVLERDPEELKKTVIEEHS